MQNENANESLPAVKRMDIHIVICHYCNQRRLVIYFILQNSDTYYLYCCDLPMKADLNVALVSGADHTDVFSLEKEITGITWLDNGEFLGFTQKDGQVTVHTEPFCYGRNLVVRVAKIITKRGC